MLQESFLTDYVYTALFSLVGMCLLILSVVVLAIRGRSDRVVTWRGLGVTFEIKPCGKCPQRKGFNG